MAVNDFSREETRLVGRLLVETNPALAIKLLTSYTPPPKPKYDLNNIPKLYTKFCEVNQLDKEHLATPYRDVFYRRIFAGAIVHIYDPEAIKYNRRIRDGVVKGVRLALDQRWPSNISRLVREAKVRRQVYDDFREKMDSTIKLFITESKKTNNEKNHVGIKKGKSVGAKRNRQ